MHHGTQGTQGTQGSQGQAHLWRHEAICQFQLLDPAQMRLHSLGARLQLTAGTAVNTQKHRKFRLSQEYQAKKHTSCDSTCKKNCTWAYAQLVLAIWELQFVEFASQCLANQQFHFQSQQSLRRAAIMITSITSPSDQNIRS